jgi:AcrR family transcriptional regulator
VSKVKALRPQPQPQRARPASPRRRKSERTRARILDAARAVFDKRGYRDTTVDHITSRAGIAHGTFYLYFRDKSQVLKELLEQAVIEFGRIAAVEPKNTAEIATLIRKSFETYQRNRLLMRLMREASASDRYFRENYDALFVRVLVENLRRSIDHIQAGASGVTVDSRAAARAIMGMVESFAYGVFVGGEEYDIDVVVNTLSYFCARAIGVAKQANPAAGMDKTGPLR